MNQRLPVILLAANQHAVEIFFSMIALSKINLLAIFLDNGDGVDIRINGKQVFTASFSSVFPFIETYKEKNVYWVIGSPVYDIHLLGTMARLLRDRGIDRYHILNGHFEICTHYQAGLRYAEQFPLDYIATGISYMEVGLDTTQIPYKGINLALSGQDLYYGYKTALDIFSRDKNMRFCLIGICPYSFGYHMRKSFSTFGMIRPYELFLPDEVWEEDIFFSLMKESFKTEILQRSDPVDQNNEKFKSLFAQNVPLYAFLFVDRELQDVTVKVRQDVFLYNMEILRKYIELCQRHGAKPIAVIFPFSPIIRDRYPQEPLRECREVLSYFQENMKLGIVDLFDMNLSYDYFYNLSHLNMRGSTAVSQCIAEQLPILLRQE